jgi:hypothetical protein
MKGIKVNWITYFIVYTKRKGIQRNTETKEKIIEFEHF